MAFEVQTLHSNMNRTSFTSPPLWAPAHPLSSSSPSHTATRSESLQSPQSWATSSPSSSSGAYPAQSHPTSAPYSLSPNTFLSPMDMSPSTTSSYFANAPPQQPSYQHATPASDPGVSMGQYADIGPGESAGSFEQTSLADFGSFSGQTSMTDHSMYGHVPFDARANPQGSLSATPEPISRPLHYPANTTVPSRWLLRGSCACCFVQYEVAASPRELPLQVCYCHCAICRNLSGSNHVAFTSVPSDRLRWYSGMWDWKSGRGTDITRPLNESRSVYTYGESPGFTTVRDAIRLWSSSRRAVRGSCAKCGSTLFISYHSAGNKTTDIALGTLWTDEERGKLLVKPVMHIMLKEKSKWEVLPNDGLLRYSGMPGEGPIKVVNGQEVHENEQAKAHGAGGTLTASTAASASEPTAGQSDQFYVAKMRHLIKCMLVY